MTLIKVVKFKVFPPSSPPTKLWSESFQEVFGLQEYTIVSLAELGQESSKYF